MEKRRRRNSNRNPKQEKFFGVRLKRSKRAQAVQSRDESAQKTASRCWASTRVTADTGSFPKLHRPRTTFWLHRAILALNPYHFLVDDFAENGMWNLSSKIYFFRTLTAHFGGTSKWDRFRCHGQKIEFVVFSCVSRPLMGLGCDHSHDRQANRTRLCHRKGRTSVQSSA